MVKTYLWQCIYGEIFPPGRCGFSGIVRKSGSKRKGEMFPVRMKGNARFLCFKAGKKLFRIRATGIFYSTFCDVYRLDHN
jgi:hypothetical protein